MEEQITSPVEPKEAARPHGFMLFVLATSLTCFLMLAIPALTLVLAIIWSVLVVLAGLGFRPRHVFFLALTNAAVLFLSVLASNPGILSGSGGAFIHDGGAVLISFGCFFGLAAYSMGLLASLGKDYYTIRTWGVIASITGISLFLAWSYLGQGSIGILEMERELNLRFEEALKAYETTGILDMYAREGISRQDLQNTFKNMSYAISRHIPATYYVQGIMAVFFTLLITAYLSLRRKIDRLIRKPYSLETMPWPGAWVVIAGLAFCLWGYDHKDAYYYIGTNILVVMTPITCYYGLAVLLFKLKEMSPAPRRWLIVLLVACSTVFLPSVIIFLSLAGLFDSLLDFRRFRLRRGESE